MNPLKVYYPFGGIHYMLRWHTHRAQHKIILTCSREALTLVAHRVFKEEVDAKICEIQKIDIVAPSDVMCARALVAQHEQAVKDFHDAVCFRAQMLHQSRERLPELFRLCMKYNPVYDENINDPDLVKDHWECRDCTYRIQVKGFSKEELYDCFHEAWDAAFPYLGADYRLRDSQAEKAPDDKPLRAALPDFGHHSPGVVLRTEVSHETTPVLFYYFYVDDVNPSTFEATLTGFRNEADEEEKKAKELLFSQRRLKEYEDLKKVYRIFDTKKE